MLRPRAPRSDRLIAVRAIDRLIGPRGEWHLCGRAALRANGVVHRAFTCRPAIAAIALSGLPARNTAGGLVLEALLRVELLLARGKDIGRAAVATGQGPILESQFFDSSGFSPNENRKEPRGHGEWQLA